MTPQDRRREHEEAFFADHRLCNTTPFSFDGYEGWVRVVDVYDGDTITVVHRISSSGPPDEAACRCVLLRVRLEGIDACELRDRDTTSRRLAARARNRLIALITGVEVVPDAELCRAAIREMFDVNVCLVWLRCSGFDKYGRVLGRVRLAPDDDASISQILLSEGVVSCY